MWWRRRPAISCSVRRSIPTHGRSCPRFPSPTSTGRSISAASATRPSPTRRSGLSLIRSARMGRARPWSRSPRPISSASARSRPRKPASRRSPDMRGTLVLLVTAWIAFLLGPAAAEERSFQEPPFFAAQVKDGTLPPIEARLPKTPLVVDLVGRDRSIGRYGGDLRTLAAKARDLRYVTVNGYTRLVGYDEALHLKPDLLESFENEGDRVFTFTLREGHRWSDGEPFTTEDFRYYWDDIANNPELSPSGPPDLFLVDGTPPKVEVLDERRIRYSWDKPNPRFLPALATPRPVFIYSPAHYLKAFHAKYADKDKLTEKAKKKKMKSW